jgi:hypothetical protein
MIRLSALGIGSCAIIEVRPRADATKREGLGHPCPALLNLVTGSTVDGEGADERRMDNLLCEERPQSGVFASRHEIAEYIHISATRFRCTDAIS